MKITKKKVFVMALTICLIATLSMGSLAWFNASDKVTNKFMIASSDGTGSAESIFSVDVWEVVDTNSDGISGVVGEGKGDGSTTAVYDAILPGSTYVKAPHVENTGAYDQFIRVVVTISDAAAWLNAVGEDIDMKDVFGGFYFASFTILLPICLRQAFYFLKSLRFEASPSEKELLRRHSIQLHYQKRNRFL